jgi:hypothetical protein
MVILASVVLQAILFFQNTTLSMVESSLRFFSYFTILTNLLAGFFLIFYSNQKAWTNQNGALTAVTMYLFMVGLVYQVALRFVWSPTGWSKLANEMLHTINPILILLVWFAKEKTTLLGYQMIPKWLIYPSFYLLFIWIRGAISGYYPYYFIDRNTLSSNHFFTNVVVLVLLFVLFSFGFIWLGRLRKNP